jgi:hypothetical protein
MRCCCGMVQAGEQSIRLRSEPRDCVMDRSGAKASLTAKTCCIE